MKHSAVIFDLDGTVIDTEPVWEAANNFTIYSRGIKITESARKKLQDDVRGLGMHEGCRIIKEQLSIKDSVEDILQEQDKIVKRLYIKASRFVSGFEIFHKKIISPKLKKGLATNSTAKVLAMANKKFNLQKFFGSHMYCVSDVNNIQKPDPAIYLHTAQKLDIPPHLCIAIEDTHCGLLAAKGAGMFCIGINTGRNRDLISKADIIVEGYTDKRLLDFFDL